MYSLSPSYEQGSVLGLGKGGTKEGDSIVCLLLAWSRCLSLINIKKGSKNHGPF